jgi:hypothetical protein
MTINRLILLQQTSLKGGPYALESGSSS